MKQRTNSTVDILDVSVEVETVKRRDSSIRAVKRETIVVRDVAKETIWRYKSI